MPAIFILLSLLSGTFLAFVFSQNIKVVYIIVGQGHFLLAYLYMYKANKINLKKIVLYFTIFISFLFFFLTVFDRHILLLVTATYFIIHYVLDSFFLNKKHINFYQLPILALPFLWIGAIRLSIYAFHIDLSNTLIYLFPLSFIFIPFIVKKIDQITLLFILFPLAVYLSILFKIDWVLFHFLHILFISHYLMWYFYIYFSKDKLFLKRFFVNFSILHVLLIFLAILYLYSKGNLFLGGFIFSDDYFYIWTLMHFVATFRISDFKLK